MPFSTTYATNILKWALGQSTAMSGHNKVFLGLCSNDPEADGGTFTELSGKGYHRVLISQYNSEYPGLFPTASRSVSPKLQRHGQLPRVTVCSLPKRAALPSSTQS